jgi:hypothetical protein
MEELIIDPRPLTLESIDSVLEMARTQGRPAALRMNAIEYADVRKFGRDRLDIETSLSVMKRGIQAHYRGVRIETTRELLPGFFNVVDENGVELVHVMRPDASRLGEAYVHPGPRGECDQRDGLCLLHHVIGS